MEEGMSSQAPPLQHAAHCHMSGAGVLLLLQKAAEGGMGGPGGSQPPPL